MALALTNPCQKCKTIAKRSNRSMGIRSKMGAKTGNTAKGVYLVNKSSGFLIHYITNTWSRLSCKWVVKHRSRHALQNKDILIFLLSSSRWVFLFNGTSFFFLSLFASPLFVPSLCVSSLFDFSEAITRRKQAKGNHSFGGLSEARGKSYDALRN